MRAAQIEQKKRERARRAARKEARPGFDEEEGAKPRGMLNKYDEEEEDAGLRIDEAGQASNAAQAAKQTEIRARLAAGDTHRRSAHCGGCGIVAAAAAASLWKL